MSAYQDFNPWQFLYFISHIFNLLSKGKGKVFPLQVLQALGVPES
jgi:hypothetical protein